MAIDTFESERSHTQYPLKDKDTQFIQNHQRGLEGLDPRLVRHRLQRAGVATEESSRVYNEIGRRLFEALLPVRMRPLRVLDCSAAAASIAKLLAKQYPDAAILSVDAVCRSLSLLHRQPRLWKWRTRGHSIAADHTALPLAASSVELVASNLSLHRRLQPDAVLAEAFRVLAPGGVLAFSTFGPDTLAELRRCWGLIDADEHVHPFADMHDLGDALVRNGFSDVVMHSERLVCHYPDLRTLHADLRQLGVSNASRQRPPSLRTPRQLARVDDAYEHLRGSAGLPVSLEVVYAHAWRPMPRLTSVPVSLA